MKKIIQLSILMLLYSCTYEIVDQESKNNEENEITIVNSVNELRKMKDIKDGQYLRTRAYYENSVGGEGLYQKIEGNLLIDDGGCTIIADDGSTYQLVIENQVSLKQFGAKGDGVTGDHDAIQYACDCAIKNNIPVYAEAGTYIIDWGQVGTPDIRINVVDKPNQNFSLIGAGKDLTIFKEEDGKTNRGGRYTKMFYVYLNQSNDVGNILFKDFTLDKNGVNNNPPPESSPYLYEQAHAIGFSGRSGHSPEFMKSLTLKNIHIVDKIGSGINFSSSTIVDHIIIENITDEPFSEKFGQRGTLEISAFSTDIIFDKINVGYMQIEPTALYAATANKRRKAFFTNCNIGNLQYTENNGAENYSEISVINSFLGITTLRNISFKIENTRINEILGHMNSPDGKFSNCQIKVPYIEENNSITSIYPTKYSTSQTYDTNIEFLNCNFVIDSNDSSITPNGYIISNAGKQTKTSPQMNCIINNCTFDQRAYGSVNNYANGNFTIKNSVLSGRQIAVAGGTYSSYSSNLILENNDYSAVTGSSLRIYDYTEEYNVSIKERLQIENWRLIVSGALNNYENNTLFKPVLLADGIPSTGHHIKGTTLEIRFPLPGEFAYYKCTSSGYGSGAIWTGYGQLDD